MWQARCLYAHPSYHLAVHYSSPLLRKISQSRSTIPAIHRSCYWPPQTESPAGKRPQAFDAATRRETGDRKWGKGVIRRPDEQNGQTYCVTNALLHSDESQKSAQSTDYKAHRNTDSVQQSHEQSGKGYIN